MTHDRPDAAELVEAVHEFLEHEILPALDEHRLRFRTRVAMIALAIARRELGGGGDGPAFDAAELARQIRAGTPPPDALPLLKAHVAAKLRVASPGYLERYG